MVVGTFPFGQPVRRVMQADRAPKRVFVLGVYASAVHARWCDMRGKQLVKALGVASEPYIFWRGEGVEDILAAIDVPREAGRLEPAGRNLNGPSGRSIDEDFLQPLGLTRADAWLCDLVPYSCMNRGQADAIRRAYAPLVERLALPLENWPRPPDKYTDAARREEIAAELLESAAEVLITLGDQPLRWFATAFGGKPSLRTYGHDANTYGRLHELQIHGRSLWLLPLVHPRQAAGLGLYSASWKALHSTWARRIALQLRSRL